MQIVNAPEMRERFSDIGIDPGTSTPKELGVYLADQMKKMREAIAISGAKRD